MSLLTIIQEATRRIAIEIPNVVMSNTDAHEQQLRALANEEGRDLAQRGAWQRLTRQAVFATLPSEEQPGVIPSDVNWIINETFFNRTRRWRVIGPLTPQEWQAQLALNNASVSFQNYRIRDNQILLFPTPGTGEEIAFEYVSKNWNVSNGVPVDSFQRDDDTPVLEEEAITLGIVWRYLQAKGFDYGEAFQKYENELESLFGRDGAKRTLSMGQPSYTRLYLNYPRVIGV